MLISLDLLQWPLARGGGGGRGSPGTRSSLYPGIQPPTDGIVRSYLPVEKPVCQWTCVVEALTTPQSRWLCSLIYRLMRLRGRDAKHPQLKVTQREWPNPRGGHFLPPCVPHLPGDGGGVGHSRERRTSEKNRSGMELRLQSLGAVKSTGTCGTWDTARNELEVPGKTSWLKFLRDLFFGGGRPLGGLRGEGM